MCMCVCACVCVCVCVCVCRQWKIPSPIGATENVLVREIVEVDAVVVVFCDVTFSVI